MLQELKDATANIGAHSEAHLKGLYAKAMVLSGFSGGLLGDLIEPSLTEEKTTRIFDLAFAAQELAYAFYLFHHRPIAKGLLVPDRPTFDYNPFDLNGPPLTEDALRLEIVSFLREHAPQTLPVELRESGQAHRPQPRMP